MGSVGWLQGPLTQSLPGIALHVLVLDGVNAFVVWRGGSLRFFVSERVTERVTVSFFGYSWHLPASCWGKPTAFICI